MNYAMIRYIIGWILNFEAAFMSPSFVVGLIYREKSAWAIFATMLLCLVIGVPMVLLKRPKQAVFYAKDGCECGLKLGGLKCDGGAALRDLRLHPSSGGCAL